MSLSAGALFVVGLVALVSGAEALVRGAARLARSFGISSLVIGLTVVAFGTSTPELAVTLQASARDSADVAIGNVFGSNISNVLLILGLSAVIAPLLVHSQLIRRDVPVMIGATVVLLVLALDGDISRGDGAALFGGAVLYTFWIVRVSRRETPEQPAASAVPDPPPGRNRPTGPAWLDVVWIVAGLVLLVVGARWVVAGAVDLADALGLSELVVGLTIVAVGTSLPELATSIVAVVRGERDLAAGNIVGSNIYNLVLVLGLGALVAPNGIPAPEAAVRFDGLVMLAVAIACLPVFFIDGAIRRWEGAVFVGYYAAYVGYLLLRAGEHDALGLYRVGLFAFALPLTALTLGVILVREVRARRHA